VARGSRGERRPRWLNSSGLRGRGRPPPASTYRTWDRGRKRQAGSPGTCPSSRAPQAVRDGRALTARASFPASTRPQSAIRRILDGQTLISPARNTGVQRGPTGSSVEGSGNGKARRGGGPDLRWQISPGRRPSSKATPLGRSESHFRPSSSTLFVREERMVVHVTDYYRVRFGHPPPSPRNKGMDRQTIFFFVGEVLGGVVVLLIWRLWFWLRHGV